MLTLASTASYPSGRQLLVDFARLEKSRLVDLNSSGWTSPSLLTWQGLEKSLLLTVGKTGGRNQNEHFHQQPQAAESLLCGQNMAASRLTQPLKHNLGPIIS